MERVTARFRRTLRCVRQPTFWPAALGLVLTAVPVYAASPWENAVNVLQTAFTGPIARGLSLVAIVVAGLMFAFGEGGSNAMLAGIVFGIRRGDEARTHYDG